MISTKTAGIFQGDVAIRTALIQGIRELRKNPDLLDYCFYWFAQDDLTSQDANYGETAMSRAKEWFLNTEIPVGLNIRMTSPKLPSISIELQASSEDTATLGDVNYDPDEITDQDPWPPATDPFAALGYDPVTGYVTLPTDITDQILIFPGMVIVDKTGAAHTILAAVDDVTIQIAPAVADFSYSVLKYQQPSQGATLESLSFRGSYAIGCHVQGEPEIALWLSSIVQFILLRYKQAYFEARGFERSTIQVTGLVRDGGWGIENVFTQYVNMTGYYRNFWPKKIGSIPAGTLTGIHVKAGPKSPSSTLNQEWDMEADILGNLADLQKLVGIKGGSEQ